MAYLEAEWGDNFDSCISELPPIDNSPTVNVVCRECGEPATDTITNLHAKGWDLAAKGTYCPAHIF